VVLTSGGPRSDDGIEVARVLSDQSPALLVSRPKEILVTQGRQRWVVGSGHDVVVVRPEALSHDARVMHIQQQLHPVSRSC
jgi:hypothetical protein